MNESTEESNMRYVYISHDIGHGVGAVQNHPRYTNTHTHNSVIFHPKHTPNVMVAQT